MIIAILAGRKGSKGFPKKNLYKVLGASLTYYPMQAAMACPEIDRVYISTDDPELIKLGKANGINIIERPPELCTDQALSEDVYVHAYNFAKERHKGCSIEIVVLLMCNAATITSEVISNGIKILRENPDYDSCVTVSKYNMWSPLRARRIDENGFLKPFVPFEALGDLKKMNCDRDSQGDVWFADMGASIVQSRCLENIEKGLLPQKWMGRKIYPLKQDAGMDIDFEWQIPQLEYWLREHGFSDPTIFRGDKNIVKSSLEIKKLKRPGRQQPIRIGKVRLDKNENTIGLDNKTLNKIISGLNPDFIASYPEIGGLYAKLAGYLGCKEENIIVTFGSDGAIRSVFEAFVNQGDEVITLNPTYAMYDVYCDMFGARKLQIDFDEKLCLNVEKLKNCISRKTRLITIPNPNSPTATVINQKDLNDILEIASRNGAIVLVDEAYYGFYDKTALPYINKYKNLVVTRTFSKTAGLASLRIGYAVGDVSIIDSLYKIKPMYESTGIGIYFAEYILDHPYIVEDYINSVLKGKAYLLMKLRDLGLKVFLSHTNFLVIKIPKVNNKLAELLLSKGILIKGGYQHTCMKDTIRITIGPHKQMVRFMRIFKPCFEDLIK